MKDVVTLICADGQEVKLGWFVALKSATIKRILLAKTKEDNTIVLPSFVDSYWVMWIVGVMCSGNDLFDALVKLQHFHINDALFAANFLEVV